MLKSGLEPMTIVSLALQFGRHKMIVHPRLSERRELKCGTSRSNKPKIRIREDGNLGRQNDYLTFKLDKIYQIMWYIFEKETRESN